MDKAKNLLTISDEDLKTQRRKEIGQRLRTFRKRRNYNLVDVSTLLADKGYGLSPSQLSRIETGEAPANTDDLTELCNLLGISWMDLLGPRRRPWFVVRKKTAQQRLREVKKGEREIIRRDSSHDDLIKKGVYAYVPLEENAEYVLEGDSERDVTLDEPKMQKYLFEIGTADEDEVLAGLDKHAGEEIIYVIKGEMEFWFEQEDTGKVERRTLKEGDCLHYPSNLRHGYRATGRSEIAEALFVYCEVGTAPQLIETPVEMPPD